MKLKNILIFSMTLLLSSEVSARFVVAQPIVTLPRKAAPIPEVCQSFLNQVQGSNSFGYNPADQIKINSEAKFDMSTWPNNWAQSNGGNSIQHIMGDSSNKNNPGTIGLGNPSIVRPEAGSYSGFSNVGQTISQNPFMGQEKTKDDVLYIPPNQIKTDSGKTVEMSTWPNNWAQSNGGNFIQFGDGSNKINPGTIGLGNPSIVRPEVTGSYSGFSENGQTISKVPFLEQEKTKEDVLYSPPHQTGGANKVDMSTWPNNWAQSNGGKFIQFGEGSSGLEKASIVRPDVTGTYPGVSGNGKTVSTAFIEPGVGSSNYNPSTGEAFVSGNYPFTMPQGFGGQGSSVDIFGNGASSSNPMTDSNGKLANANNAFYENMYSQQMPYAPGFGPGVSSPSKWSNSLEGTVISEANLQNANPNSADIMGNIKYPNFGNFMPSKIDHANLGTEGLKNIKPPRDQLVFSEGMQGISHNMGTGEAQHPYLGAGTLAQDSGMGGIVGVNEFNQATQNILPGVGIAGTEGIEIQGATPNMDNGKVQSPSIGFGAFGQNAGMEQVNGANGIPMQSAIHPGKVINGINGGIQGMSIGEVQSPSFGFGATGQSGGMEQVNGPLPGAILSGSINGINGGMQSIPSNMGIGEVQNPSLGFGATGQNGGMEQVNGALQSIPSNMGIGEVQNPNIGFGASGLGPFSYLNKEQSGGTENSSSSVNASGAEQDKGGLRTKAFTYQQQQQNQRSNFHTKVQQITVGKN